MWGPYRALIGGEAGDVVEGMVFEMWSEAQGDLLRFYKTSTCKVVEREIEIKRGRALRGRTSRWAREGWRGSVREIWSRLRANELWNVR